MKKKKRSWTVIIPALFCIPALYVAVQIYSATKVTYEYETVIQYQMTDSMEAEGVALYQETPIQGSGMLGYLVKDGERVSSGTSLAEVYTSSEQAKSSVRLSEIDGQIDLLQKSQNTASTKIDVLMAQRSTAIYNLLDSIDKNKWNTIPSLQKDYLLAQNKLQITTGEIGNFNPLIEQLQQEQTQINTQLTGLETIKSPAMGYFVSAENTQLLNVDKAQILAMSAQELQNAMQEGVTKNMDGLVGKIISGYTWQFCGVCSIENSERFEKQKTVRISFPGKMEEPLTANVVSIEKDTDNGIAKFVLQCDYVNADVLKLGKETAKIDFATYTGLRVNANAIRYVREQPDKADSEQQPSNAEGENYVPGVYVKYGNLARFRRIKEIYRDNTGTYILVPTDGGLGKESEVRLYDEVIVAGQELYDGKLL